MADRKLGEPATAGEPVALHPYCAAKGDGKCHRVGGCVCGAKHEQAATAARVRESTPLPKFLDLTGTEASAVDATLLAHRQPQHTVLLKVAVCDGLTELDAVIEVRLIHVTNRKTAHRTHYNVTVGEYEGQPKAGHS